jgi:hypothetical protein
MRRITALLAVLIVFSAFACADVITLKDDQQFSAEVTGFDSYYLTVVLPNSKTVNIPWREVRFVKHTTTSSSWLESTYINTEETEVTTLVSPISEDKAFWNAVFPGFIIHGSGHFYAKNQNMGMSLMSAEIVSLAIMAVSVNEVLAPVAPDESNTVSTAVFLTGLTMFTVSWVWDMIFARSTAAEYNASHEFLMNGTKPPAEAAPAVSNAEAAIISVTQPDAAANTANTAK